MNNQNITVREFKAKVSQYLKRIEQGEIITVNGLELTKCVHNAYTPQENSLNKPIERGHAVVTLTPKEMEDTILSIYNLVEDNNRMIQKAASQF